MRFRVISKSLCSTYLFVAVSLGCSPQAELNLRASEPNASSTTEPEASVSPAVDVETVEAPTFSVTPDTYSTAQSVMLATTTAGATIYYTTDGTQPTTESNEYNSEIVVSATTTIKAFAAKADWISSAVASAVYTITEPGLTGTVTTPTFSVAEGTYSSTQTVTITSTTSGAIIYYTTDGTTPTSASSIYGAPLSISATETVKAFATKSMWIDSDIASAA